MSEHIEIFKNVNVEYDKGASVLYINDYETDEQLAIFYVDEED